MPIVSCNNACGIALLVDGKQLVADFPEDRLDADSPPFTNTDVYLFGPLNVQRFRSVLKRHGENIHLFEGQIIHHKITSD